MPMTAIAETNPIATILLTFIAPSYGLFHAAAHSARVSEK
jgi:hypothetical protein